MRYPDPGKPALFFDAAEAQRVLDLAIERRLLPDGSEAEVTPGEEYVCPCGQNCGIGRYLITVHTRQGPKYATCSMVVITGGIQTLANLIAETEEDAIMFARLLASMPSSASMMQAADKVANILARKNTRAQPSIARFDAHPNEVPTLKSDAETVASMFEALDAEGIKEHLDKRPDGA